MTGNFGEYYRKMGLTNENADYLKGEFLSCICIQGRKMENITLRLSLLDLAVYLSWEVVP